MRADGSVKNYAFVQKEHWRRWAWNQVRERADLSGNCVVLYLAGPADHDRRIATEKGLPEAALVGVDRCASNVQRCRAAGGFAVAGDIMDVAIAWPAHTRVAAVVADFCGGISSDTRGLHAHIGLLFPGVVVVANLLRGRDAAANGMRSVLKEWGFAPPKCLPEGGERHRGWQMLAGGALEKFIIALPDLVPKHLEKLLAIGAQELGMTVSLQEAVREGDRLVKAAARKMAADDVAALRPQFSSYRSGHLRYDSYVVTMPQGKRCPDEWFIRPPGEVARRIAATLAHRTRRLRVM